MGPVLVNGRQVSVFPDPWGDVDCAETSAMTLHAWPAIHIALARRADPRGGQALGLAVTARKPSAGRRRDTGRDHARPSRSRRVRAPAPLRHLSRSRERARHGREDQLSREAPTIVDAAPLLPVHLNGCGVSIFGHCRRSHAESMSSPCPSAPWTTVRVLLGFQRLRARQHGTHDGRSGSVTVIQRFGAG